jgi:hypothetical protein
MAIVYGRRIGESTWYVDQATASNGKGRGLYTLIEARGDDAEPHEVGESYLSLAEAARAIEARRFAA